MNLIVGVGRGLSVARLLNWVRSAKQIPGYMQTFSLMYIHADDRQDPELETLCKDNGILLRFAKPRQGGRIHDERYLHAWMELEKWPYSESLVLWSDVTDVVFQADPFPWIKECLQSKNKRIIIGSEGVKINREPWNSDNFHRTFPHLFDRFSGQNDVVCSGVMAGYLEDMKDLLLSVYMMSKDNKGHDIVDQSAVMARLCEPDFRHRVHLTNTSETLMAHCAVSGPTEFFVKWGFRDSYQYALPQWDSQRQLLVHRDSRTPFCIVHQYNRIPDWKRAYDSRYS